MKVILVLQLASIQPHAAPYAWLALAAPQNSWPDRLLGSLKLPSGVANEPQCAQVRRPASTSPQANWGGLSTGVDRPIQ
jgi:hypothetical protein